MALQTLILIGQINHITKENYEKNIRSEYFIFSPPVFKCHLRFYYKFKKLVINEQTLVFGALLLTQEEIFHKKSLKFYL